MPSHFDLEEVLAIGREQRREQGLPERVEDPTALRAIARLITAGRDNKKTAVADTTAA